MDSNLPIAPATPPAPGTMPLRNAQHELFAQARAMCLGLVVSARHAGYDTMTPGNAAKIDRMRKVRERVKFLAGNTEDTIRRKREQVERELGLVAYANMDDFVVVGDDNLPALNLGKLKEMPDSERRELMAAVKAVRYTENGPTFELHPKHDALAQLRKLNGLDAPERVALTDPSGAGPARLIAEVVWKAHVAPETAAAA